MFHGADSIDRIKTYNADLDQHLDRVAREIEVQRLLEPADPNRSTNLEHLYRPGIVDSIVRWFRPRGRNQEPSGV